MHAGGFINILNGQNVNPTFMIRAVEQNKLNK